MKNYILIILSLFSSVAFAQQAPHADFSMSDSVICAGGCIEFTNLSSNNATSWDWSSDCYECDYEYKNAHFCYYGTGVHYVKLVEINAYGSDSIQKSIYVLAAPTQPVLVSNGDSVVNRVNYSSPTRYQWFENNIALDSDTASFIIVPQPDIYELQVTDVATGCTATGSISLIATGINIYNNEQGLEVYPNPVSDNYIHLTIGRSWLDSRAEVYDINGRLILQLTISEQQTIIPVGNIAGGIYVLRLLNNDRTETRKIVKE